MAMTGGFHGARGYRACPATDGNQEKRYSLINSSGLAIGPPVG